MEAQILIVFQNGHDEAVLPNTRNRSTKLDVEKAADLKNLIWTQLKTIGRNGHILVRWQGKTYLCEMKQDKTGYTRTEIEYHPHMNRFTI